MNLNKDLVKINQNLASSGTKLRIEQRGSRLSLRGPLPCQESPKEFKVQRISLGLPSNQKGLQQAEKLLQLINLQIEHEQFNWERWSKKSPRKFQPKNKVAIEEIIEQFKLEFFDINETIASKASKRSNWNAAYKPYLRRLQEKAISNNCSLNKELFLETLTSYSANSRSRQQCGTALNALANYLKIKLPDNWRKKSYGYGLHKAQFRKLPSDAQIEEAYQLIPNPEWKLVFGLMATYGLRNHEVFFCDISCLKNDGDKILRVFPNTKTGEHQVWPFPPQWINLFDLNQLGENSNTLPKIETDLSQTTLQQVGKRVSEQFRRYNLPLTPYDLRHAWAIRTIHLGLPDTVSARMMGHSVAIHTRTYHHWITRRDQQKAVDAALASITN
ncbi:site-specific integrase [Prochlorococcus marinus]|nr:site-specific integrase [Prochlorococcus marinus]